MVNRNNRPYVSRARQRSFNKKRLIIIGGALAALLVVVALVLLLPKGGRDNSVEAIANVTPKPTSAPGVPLQAEGELLQAEGEPLEPQVTPTPTPAPAEDQAVVNSRRAATRPTPTAEGFMPVFFESKTDEKIVAITVDDCYQGENLKQIVDKAIEVGGKLTIFPIGKNTLRQTQSEVLKYAWEQGFELENHTFTHNGLYACSDEEMTKEIYWAQQALSYILGVNYQCHFLRPKGGDARGDQRLQMYAKQLGYYGIAQWSASGSAGASKIAKSLKPGTIYLFHTTDEDLEKLLQFIPWVAEQGYQMVTLNEMFGYPANETRELTEPIDKNQTPPALEPYEVVYVPLKKTTYSWEAYLVQQKLIELGYLKGKADGEYGTGSAKAVMAYQKDHGMKQTGVADAELVRTLLEGT